MPTETTTTRRIGLPSGDYYVPDFRVEVEGFDIDQGTKGDVIELKVVMDIDNMTSFELTINNWDDEKLDSKYTDARLAEIGSPSPKRMFDVGNRVRIRMGYVNELRWMAKGQIMTVSPHFPESGPPTITVSGLDGMVRLRDRHPRDGETKRYKDRADWQIAQEVAKRNNVKSRVSEIGTTHPLVVQKNQDDAMFLKERAKRIDFECFFYVDPTSGDEVLAFVSPTDARDGRKANVYVLNWGENLMSFSTQLSIAHQVGKVTVLGWDPRTKERIREVATPADLPRTGTGGTSGPEAAAEVLDGKEEIIVDAPVQSKEEARKLALSRLTERAYGFMTGSGQVMGLPDLRQGDNVELGNLGKRFNGLYYVKRVEHVFGSSGYVTRFNVRRVFDGGRK